MSTPAERFLTDLIAGDATAIRAMFPSIPALDTPFSGPLAGEEALEAMVAAEGSWLRLLGARAETRRVIRGDTRVVAEVVLTIHADGATTDLPAAVVGQLTPGGLGHLRTYHSFWPIEGSHRPRSPIVWPTGRIDEPAVVKRYFAALADGDAEAIEETFTPDGSIQEPSGEAFRHVGPRGRAAFYQRAFERPGGVPLEHVTATTDGRTFAIEYVADRWGELRFPPTPGCAVYDLDASHQLIEAVRIYDDIAPPSEELER